MIDPRLLVSTDGQAPGIMIYGAPGLKKTHSISTCPPPVLLLSVGEGGTGSVIPWIRRRRNSDEDAWVEITQEQREFALSLVSDEVRYFTDANGARADRVRFKPGPFIDVIHFDNLDFDTYAHFIKVLSEFNAREYNTLALDSLQEFSIETQTFTKGKGNELRLVNEVNFGWAGAQERANILLRKLRNLRRSGVVIYTTGSEDISKDYVKNPMEKRAQGELPPEPYSIRGTVNLPGKLAEGIAHIPDIMCHARLVSGDITWITQPEMLQGGGAWWDAKDRYGRLAKWIRPDIYSMFTQLYGKEVAKQIYAAAREHTTAEMA